MGNKRITYHLSNKVGKKRDASCLYAKRQIIVERKN